MIRAACACRRRDPAGTLPETQFRVDRRGRIAILGTASSGFGRGRAGLSDLNPSRLARSGPAGSGPRLSPFRPVSARQAADRTPDRAELGCADARIGLSFFYVNKQSGGNRTCAGKLFWLDLHWFLRLAPAAATSVNRRLSARVPARSVLRRWVATWLRGLSSAVPATWPSARCIRTSAVERRRLRAPATVSTGGVPQRRGAPFRCRAPGARVEEAKCSTRS